MHNSLRKICETSRELEAANRALQSSENRLRSLIELAADAIYIANPGGRIIDANHRACGLGGFEKGELLGLAVADDFPRERPSARAMSLDRLIAGTETAFGAEMKRKDGSTVTVELAAKPMPDGTIQVICRDVSDRLRAAERTLHVQKLESIGCLAGGVAHDFNNLLTVINGYGELLLRGMGPATRCAQPLDEIAKAGERAAALTRQLLAFSRKQMSSPGR